MFPKITINVFSLITINNKSAVVISCILLKSFSVLESEMYQLSHMLTEQKGLMSSMMEMSLVSDKGK